MTEQAHTEGQWSEQIKFWLNTWSDDMRTTAYRHVRPDAIIPHLLTLMDRKEGEYDMSWAKRGVLGYWHGAVARQQDRVDPGFTKLLSQPLHDADSPITKRVARSLIRTLADIANYAMMGMCMLASMYPDEYDDWVESVEKGD
jgi:hypothetical protein